jgi:hypothetical protein
VKVDHLDPDLRQAMQAEQEERYDDALQSLVAVFGRVQESEEAARVNWFGIMFTWRLLSEAHAPARAALARLRDKQAARLLDGDFIVASGRSRPHTRFGIVYDMNDILGDTRATWELFVRLEAMAPDHARREAYLALPSIVQAGDFARAERYLPRNPLDRLKELAATAQRFPLFPPDRAAPRLAAELSNFMRDVRLCAATWEGLGRGAEAEQLRAAALAGLPSDELRALAGRELEEPGAINRALAAHQMAQDEADGTSWPAYNPPG